MDFSTSGETRRKRVLFARRRGGRRDVTRVAALRLDLDRDRQAARAANATPLRPPRLRANRLIVTSSYLGVIECRSVLGTQSQPQGICACASRCARRSAAHWRFCISAQPLCPPVPTGEHVSGNPAAARPIWSCTATLFDHAWFCAGSARCRGTASGCDRAGRASSTRRSPSRCSAGTSVPRPASRCAPAAAASPPPPSRPSPWRGWSARSDRRQGDEGGEQQRADHDGHSFRSFNVQPPPWLPPAWHGFSGLTEPTLLQDCRDARGCDRLHARALRLWRP